MNPIMIRKLFKNQVSEKIIIVIASLVLLYLLISLYFTNHFFFNTEINGVNLSLKSYHDVDQIIRNYIKNYELKIIERNGEIEIMTGQNIGMQYNENNSISKTHHAQHSIKWISSLFQSQKYIEDDLYFYNEGDLINRIHKLKCLNKEIVEPRSVNFKYFKGIYEVEKEVYGNKLIPDKLNEVIETTILTGKVSLDLNETACYENPKYTMRSVKTLQTKNLLNKYVSTKITYLFGSKNERLDGTTINKWLRVDEKLEVIINKIAVMKYVKGLSRKYDTVGATRAFKASTGEVVEVTGGLYGWKMNQEAVINEISEKIATGEEINKEPIYSQKALSRDGNEIGNTYVEINISRQRLWFYKGGKLITQGFVVTGNPNKGNSTVLGTYMLNYKQNLATLQGPGYEVEVTYWMPFYGNMGIHDATWRYSFGGEIYKRNGTHGCVKAPFYLAKAIFENIDIGIPIICYEEKKKVD